MAGDFAGLTVVVAVGKNAGAASGAPCVEGAASGASVCASPKLLLATAGATALPPEENTTCCVLPKTGLVLLTVVLSETAALCCTAWETSELGPAITGAPLGTALAPSKSWD